MKRSIGDFEVDWAESGVFIGARRKDPPKHQYYFRVSEGRPHFDPSLSYEDTLAGGPKVDFREEAREAAEEFLRLEQGGRAPTA
jgi:hypothetical protein